MQVSRATYMALNVYQEDGPITQVCAGDVDMCTNILTDSVLTRTGAVLSCLRRMQKGSPKNSTKTTHKLEPACDELLTVAQPPDMKEEFDSNLKVGARCFAGTRSHARPRTAAARAAVFLRIDRRGRGCGRPRRCPVPCTCCGGTCDPCRARCAFTLPRAGTGTNAWALPGTYAIPYICTCVHYGHRGMPLLPGLGVAAPAPLAAPLARRGPLGRWPDRGWTLDKSSVVLEQACAVLLDCLAGRHTRMRCAPLAR